MTPGGSSLRVRLSLVMFVSLCSRQLQLAGTALAAYNVLTPFPRIVNVEYFQFVPCALKVVSDRLIPCYKCLIRLPWQCCASHEQKDFGRTWKLFGCNFEVTWCHCGRLGHQEWLLQAIGLTSRKHIKLMDFNWVGKLEGAFRSLQELLAELLACWMASRWLADGWLMVASVG